jgi:hypothetical protein
MSACLPETIDRSRCGGMMTMWHSQLSTCNVWRGRNRWYRVQISMSKYQIGEEIIEHACIDEKKKDSGGTAATG